MKSHWDLGKRPKRQRDEAAYKEVSTFNTLEAAASKARLLNLGEYIVELEVPESAIASQTSSSGHVGLAGLTPDDLLASICSVTPLDEVLH